MASIPQDSAFGTPTETKPLSDQIRAMVKPLASLKITVTVFSLSLFLILIGSLAQARTDVWEVVGQYFRCWIAWVDLRDLFPPAFFPPGDYPQLADSEYWKELWINKLCVRAFDRPQIPFPGGWLLGAIATVNLLAAHGLKFKVQAKGGRLIGGLACLAAGVAVSWIVIAGGMNADGFQTDPILDYKVVWRVFQFTMIPFVLWITWRLFGVVEAIPSKWDLYRFILPSRFASGLRKMGLYQSRVGLVVGCAGLVAILALTEPLSAASMRILWQLMKAQFASLILLWACWLLFKKRAAVVLLHAGVAVLMLSEVLVGLTVSENRFQMWEGDTANYVFDLRERELVVVDNRGDEAKVVSVPEKLIVDAAKSEDEDGRIISDERLPFDMEVVEFFRNSTLRNAKPEDKNLATAGLGVKVLAVKAKQAGGMDSKSDESAAYVRIRDKETGKALGTYMLAMRLEGQAEPVLVDGALFDLSMRFKRTYKPYTVTLLDVEKNDYLGTTTPRDYASTVLLKDPENNVEREVRIWMNNPLRYRGETLYQTDYFLNEETGAELSSLQVVNNRGWMLPYLACMIVLTGMAVQFGTALKRYSDRRTRGVDAATVVDQAAASGNAASRPGIGLALVVALIVVGYFGSKFRPPSAKDGQANLYAFGKIPVVKGGRQQPLSSVAMNRMRVLTNGKTTFHRELRAEEFKEDWDNLSEDIAAAIPGMKAADLADFEGGVPELMQFISAGSDLKEEEIYQRLSKRNMFGVSAITRRAPAMWWMLDLISQRPEADRHRVIRIDQPQVLSVLRLEQPREGAMYSFGEVMEHFKDEKVEKAIAEASKQFKEDADRAEPFQRRLLALASKVGRITQTRDVFTPFEFDKTRPHSSLLQCLGFKDLLGRMGDVSDSALALQVPRPSPQPGEEWEAIPLASIKGGLIEFANSNGKTDIDGLVEALVDQLPSELVDLYLRETVERLKPGIDEENSLNKLAARVIPTLQQDDFHLKQALEIISSSDKDNAADILANASEAQRARLYELGVAEFLYTHGDEVSQEAKDQVREVFGSGDVTKEAIAKLARTYTKEIAQKILTDAEVAAGPSEASIRLAELIDAWKSDDIEQFNKLSVKHCESLAEFSEQQTKDAKSQDEKVVNAAAPIVDVRKTSFEAWFNNAAPSYYCAAMYLIAFAIACVSLVVWPERLGRIAFVITLVTFVFHTLALVGRVYISGRPPVTNLYSSAVFIGWGAVLLGLIFEFVNRRGIGNLVSTAAGTATLVIAYFLGKDGDTFEVLQAVLDTQFWLATHVVCITLGYSATFLAGLFGMVYIVKGFFTSSLGDSDRKELSRMVYGTICFAMLFSFVGTILGGLWADDSWGRFWGWDPKENGAMMIVIWNAIVMHARWDNMIKDRGMAVLSVVGNIVTAWSWFGVNELRAGLHSYGFTEGRLFWLNMWIVLNLLFLVVGLMPKSWWRSFRKDGEMKVA